MTAGSSEWRQHWTVLVPGLAGVMLCAVNNYSLGVMIGPLEEEFGWSRAQISAGPLIISFIALLFAPLVGIAIDRFGPRRIGLFGVVAFCAALAFLSTATPDIMSWWVRWVILGLASMVIMPTVWIAAINSFFSKNRGKALAIALCGTGISATFIPSLTNAMIEAWGWRQAYVGLAGLCLLTVMPLVYFLFRGATDPKRGDRGTSGAPAAVLTGFSRREGLTSPAFLKLACAIVVFGIAGGVTANAVPILIDKGFDRSVAAAVAGLIGIGAIIGRLVGGVLLDLFDAKKVAAVSVVGPVVTIALFLLFPGEFWPAAIGCVILGLSVGTEYDACAYLSARHFGMRSFGALFGTINGLVLFSNGVAPISANYVYDVTRSYDLVLWAIIPLCLVTALLFLSLGRYPDFTGNSTARDDTGPPEPALQAPAG